MVSEVRECGFMKAREQCALSRRKWSTLLNVFTEGPSNRSTVT